MGFFYGLVGAVLGTVLGGAVTLLVVTISEKGDDFATAFDMVIFGWVGLVVGAILGIVAALRTLRYVRIKYEDKHKRRKTVLIVASFVAAVPALVAGMLWDAQRYSDPPSDQQLLRNFNAHHAAFDELAQMKQTDKGLQSIGNDFMQPDNPKAAGISSEKIAKYRWLLSSAGVQWGLGADGPSGADFTVWSQGSAISSDINKGYAYLTVPPKQILKSLDNCGPDGENMVKAYRHIEGCWYLYYDYLPG